MADPKAENNVQHFLAKIAGVDTSTPTPQTNVEHYLAKIAGEDVDIPEKPSTTEEYYLDKIAKGGIGVEVVPLSATENGTYTAEEGKAYSPVNVNVSQTTIAPLNVTRNGRYTAGEGIAYNPVTVNVPAPVDGPYGMYTVGDTISNPAYECLISGGQLASGITTIAYDGNVFASLVSFISDVAVFRRENQELGVQFVVTVNDRTITGINGANGLMWWRFVLS